MCLLQPEQQPELQAETQPGNRQTTATEQPEQQSEQQAVNGQTTAKEQGKTARQHLEQLAAKQCSERGQRTAEGKQSNNSQTTVADCFLFALSQARVCRPPGVHRAAAVATGTCWAYSRLEDGGIGATPTATAPPLAGRGAAGAFKQRIHIWIRKRLQNPGCWFWGASFCGA